MNDFLVPDNETQLQVLGELIEVLDAAAIRSWLRGGWAVDFLLGAVTRPHADLDLVAWQRHRGHLARALTAAGFILVTETDKQADWRWRGVDISFVFLERAQNGEIVTHAIPEWTWQPDALLLRRVQLGGVLCRVVSPRQLLIEKMGYQRGTGRPLRPQDLAAMEMLRRLVAGDPQLSPATESNLQS